MTLKLTFEAPDLKVNDKVLNQELNRIGAKLATKVRRALKAGTNYDGAALPDGADGAPIDLVGETETLIKSIKYSRGAKEIAPTGNHPQGSKSVRTNYGVMSVLQSGIGRNGARVREPFDFAGDRNKVYDDASDLLTDALNARGDELIP